VPIQYRLQMYRIEFYSSFRNQLDPTETLHRPDIPPSPFFPLFSEIPVPTETAMSTEIPMSTEDPVYPLSSEISMPTEVSLSYGIPI
jgi:hypothetical protein